MSGRLSIPYEPPVSPESHGFLALSLTLAGFFFMALFFTYEMRAGAKRSLASELPLALASSVFLGIGSLFVMLWAGLYV